MTTIETLTNEQILNLWAEAEANGDDAMSQMCNVALSAFMTPERDRARAGVVRAIRGAEAMQDDTYAQS